MDPQTLLDFIGWAFKIAAVVAIVGALREYWLGVCIDRNRGTSRTYQGGKWRF